MKVHLATPANSSPPQHKPKEEQDACSIHEDNVCRIIRFLQQRDRGINTTASLRITNPDDQLLRLLQEARDPLAAQDRPGPNPIRDAVGLSVLLRLRLRYILTYTPPVLVLRPMPSAVHDCIHDFLTRFILTQAPGESRLLGLMTPAELACLAVTYGSTASLPGGPADGGYRDPAAGIPRTKPRGIDKEPDVAIRYNPLVRSGQRRDMAAQPTWIADADDVQLDGASVSAIPVFAPLVIEVAYSESYEDAHADCADYLLSAAGKISLAILVRIKDPRRTRDTTAAAATTPPPSPRSTPPDSPDSASEAYEAIAEAVWRADRMQLEAFIECWELLPATATQQRQVALRCPRIWILKDGKRSSLVKVPMCRADFGLAGREMVDVDWTEFGMKIKDARMQTQVSSVIRERKVARAQRRVAVGDVGADYVPEATAW